MKKILVSLLLVLIGLQTSYSAMASYCSFESESSVHVGHHQHGQTQESQKSDSMKISDIECDLCHISHSSFLTKSAGMGEIKQQIVLYVETSQSLTNPILPLPDKPNWIDLA